MQRRDTKLEMTCGSHKVTKQKEQDGDSSLIATTVLYFMKMSITVILPWELFSNNSTLPGLLICDSISASTGTLTKITLYFLLETHNSGLFPSNKTKTQPNSQHISVISLIGKKVKEIVWKSLSANRPQGKQQGNCTHLLYST